MTRVAPNQPVEVAAPRESRGILLAWTISRAGAVACGLAEGLPGPAVRLNVRIPEPGDRPGPISAHVLDGERVAPIDVPQSTGRWIEDSIRGVWHLDIDGVLKLTIRRTEDRVEALYARTELLARAGVAGGRDEFDGARAAPESA